MSIHISTLGLRGIGNCLFQYAAAKAYAEKTGEEIQTPPWAGERIFNIQPCPVKPGPPVLDFADYFQTQTAVSTYSRSQARVWFSFRPEFQHLWKQTPRRRVVAHVRRGANIVNKDRYALVNASSYVKAAEKLGFKEADIFWVTDGQVFGHPLGNSPDTSYMPDFMSLMKCDVLLRGNSTFSWWAAVLGEGRVYSPVVGDRVGFIDCDFAEGNWPRMTPGFEDLYLKD